ncbi:MAG: phosphotransferase [Eubacterium sp.]
MGCHNYKDLNKENIVDYLKECAHYFAPEAVLHVYEIGGCEEDGDGFVNFLYRVWDENGKSVIVKQAKTYYKAFGEGVGPFVIDRNALEADVMRIKSAITPEYIPEVYDVDLENHIYLCEDCSHLRILRFELMKGKKFPKFPKQIGEFIAKSNFYTSEIYLDAVVHKELQTKFMNPKMRLIFEIGLFLRDESAIEWNDPHDDPSADQERLSMGDAPWKSKAFRTEMLKLREIHMKKNECLVHGDLHTSNIMIDENEAKVIDMEYMFMGASSSDSGYLMGSILYEYIRWFYMPGYSEEFCADFRQTILDNMTELIHTYFDVYTDCWKKDAKPTYRDYDDYRDYILHEYLQEMCGFMGCQIISRVGKMVPLPDFDTIEDRDDRNEACRLSLIIGNYLIMHREEMETIEDIIDVIVKMTKSYRAMIKVLE